MRWAVDGCRSALSAAQSPSYGRTIPGRVCPKGPSTRARSSQPPPPHRPPADPSARCLLLGWDRGQFCVEGRGRHPLGPNSCIPGVCCCQAFLVAEPSPSANPGLRHTCAYPAALAAGIGQEGSCGSRGPVQHDPFGGPSIGRVGDVVLRGSQRHLRGVASRSDNDGSSTKRPQTSHPDPHAHSGIAPPSMTPHATSVLQPAPYRTYDSTLSGLANRNGSQAERPQASAVSCCDRIRTLGSWA